MSFRLSEAHGEIPFRKKFVSFLGDSSATLGMTSMINAVPFALTASKISILSRETPDAAILSNIQHAT